MIRARSPVFRKTSCSNRGGKSCCVAWTQHDLERDHFGAPGALVRIMLERIRLRRNGLSRLKPVRPAMPA